jgi:hypothetical protein
MARNDKEKKWVLQYKFCEVIQNLQFIENPASVTEIV